MHKHDFADSNSRYFPSFAYLEVKLIPTYAIALVSITVYDNLHDDVDNPEARPCTNIGAVSQVRNILKTA